MKRKMFVCALCLIALAVTVSGTLAYFTAEDTARNVITAGNVKIELQEKMISADGKSTVPFTDPLNVMPGSEVSKIVEVRNTGGQPAWVRVSVEKTIALAEGIQGDADLTLISFDLNTAHWTEKDGFYYYTASLAPGQTTEPLFTAVSFAESMSDLYQSSKAVLQIHAYATQTANNGSTVFEAAGWPETN